MVLDRPLGGSQLSPSRSQLLRTLSNKIQVLI
jgi:hypothetical protein